MSQASVVVRGGPDTARKIAAHAQRTARAFNLDGRPALGVSAFAVLEDVGPASLAGILQRTSTCRTVYVVAMVTLERAGFTVLPTFQRPHVTVMLRSLDDAGELPTVLGPGELNPRYGEMTRRPRRRPQ